MENSLKGLLLAAGTIITCIVISLGFFISREAKETASNGANQIGKLNAEFLESDKVIYDGASVSGSEVINVIKKMQSEDVGICVVTKKTSKFYGFEFDAKTGEFGSKVSSDTESAVSSSSEYYINPYVEFTGIVVRDVNNLITGIVFSQV